MNFCLAEGNAPVDVTTKVQVGYVDALPGDTGRRRLDAQSDKYRGIRKGDYLNPKKNYTGTYEDL